MALLCPQCFDNNGLRNRLVAVRPNYDEGKCDFHPTRKGIPVEAVSAIVDEVFRQNYDFGDPAMEFLDGDFVYSQQGDRLRDVVEGLTEAVDESITDLLVAQLIADDNYWPGDGEMPFYLEYDGFYERISHGDAGHGQLWDAFCQTIVHDQRFFNREADGLLQEIFKNIHLQRSESRLYPVHVLQPETAPALFRARVVDEAELKAVRRDPCVQLGPPPRRRGRPNRMNPSGVLAFYGSLDLTTCISELRPLVGSQVVSAEFRIRRPIVVLDTTRFEAPPKELNLFAKDHVRRLAQWRFMQRFMAEIAKPISPSDEHIDYIPTQAVAEYLNKLHAVRIGKAERRIDGILFRSAQRPAGVNLVLFGEAALVERSAKAQPQRPHLSSPSFDLQVFEPPPPEDPGLTLVDGTLRVDTVTEASFSMGQGRHLSDSDEIDL
ncbi:RES domain-containing protein [Phenylobacterium sp. 58.2.17]|uniref:RES domain-containing protein n=1 Tax=Phenylobacterium sp. 58.2.17 TaxID=2969306 RepID=UPI002263F454|nr:RES domain-containing protein [Phenylobacterium sp. 58.2.17]MCX7587264.1 RES domain-containing protein [Phenylobacterium sp. 58.2.17]